MELAVRMGEFEAENGLYNYGLASSATTPRHLHEWVGGVNWYLNRLFRIIGRLRQHGFRRRRGGICRPGGNRPTEKVFILRFQINFI